MRDDALPISKPDQGSPLEIFRAFLKLGLTSFGGPIAHLGYFRDELVVRRKWIDEVGYADLVALCQFLPGPASSRLSASTGWMRECIKRCPSIVTAPAIATVWPESATTILINGLAPSA